MGIELYKKIANSKGKDVLSNEIEHLFYLGKMLTLNFEEYKVEREKIIAIYSQLGKTDETFIKQTHYEFIRRLYNVLQMYYSFLEHIKEVLNKYEKSIDFKILRVEFGNLKDTKAIFIGRLRAFITHHGIPKTIITQTYKDPIEVEVYLDKKHLLKWNGWNDTKKGGTEDCKNFLEKQEEVHISPLLVEKINSLFNFSNELIKQIATDNEADIEEYNALIDEWNKFVKADTEIFNKIKNER